MSVAESDIAFVSDLFAPLGEITTRRMMGGLSIYCNGTIFAALNSTGTLYLKAKGAFAREMAAAGAHQFDAGDHKMGYWSLPENAFDDPEVAQEWARRALKNL